MSIIERQTEGIAALTAVAVIVYICKFLMPLFLPLSPNAPFPESRAHAIAVSLTLEGKEKGVFFLPQGARISDLLIAAGVDPKKYESEIGERPIKAGDQVQIGKDTVYNTGKMDAARALALNLPLDINRLSLKELVLIPGIGEKTAAKIVAFRKEKGAIRNMEELMEIKGIKEKKLAKLKKYLFIEKKR